MQLKEAGRLAVWAGDGPCGDASAPSAAAEAGPQAKKEVRVPEGAPQPPPTDPSRLSHRAPAKQPAEPPSLASAPLPAAALLPPGPLQGEQWATLLRKLRDASAAHRALAKATAAEESSAALPSAAVPPSAAAQEPSASSPSLGAPLSAAASVGLPSAATPVVRPPAPSGHALAPVPPVVTGIHLWAPPHMSKRVRKIPAPPLRPPPAAPLLPRVPLDRPLRLSIGSDGRARAAPLEVETSPASADARAAAEAGTGARMSEAEAAVEAGTGVDVEAGGGGRGGAGDSDLEGFLELLPTGLQDEVRRCATEAPTEAASAADAADGSRRSAPPPLLVDLAADAGRDVRLAFSDGSKRTLQGVKAPIGPALEQLATHVRALNDSTAAEDGAPYYGEEVADGPAPPSLPLFGSDNRCCPPGTLHRVSAMRDPRSGRVIGLTYRVGRHLPGVAGPLADVLADLAGRGRAWAQAGTEAGGTEAVQRKTARHLAGSLLLLGRPGSGKTTLLRDIVAHLSDGLGLGVVVVDTSNEIAGGDALPHACIGSARRLMVGPRHRLAEAMIEAVQNHGPQVIVVDEIANAAEVAAARTIAARGVMLVSTAHGTGLRSLMANNELVPLVGGMQSVILGDAKAVQGNRGVKTRTERRGKAVFRSMVEVLRRDRLLLRPDVASSVDAILGSRPSTQQWQQEEEDEEDVVHAPGSLLLHRSSSGAGEAGGSTGGAAEPLPPLEQLRVVEPGWGPNRGRLRVRLLELGAEAPDED
ncbi:hypothetical protein HYH03_001699 [Edaphochlamys debaryana]|uniref:AAA+ ATPase domain-containing protein n=1 Tax=Edaphochlamys debaryana TaxID=47281 RepID=A0A835YBX9_9CHLO|nr:hypothetical protein HYH03_001699 [Edaphochlamys debaryana]|eukprot:KAG2500117.1 hypothetical protein HYH03_001699 [Edaphochlamys debaryana]